jgi:hypothetical protein
MSPRMIDNIDGIIMGTVVTALLFGAVWQMSLQDRAPVYLTPEQIHANMKACWDAGLEADVKPLITWGEETSLDKVTSVYCVFIPKAPPPPPTGEPTIPFIITR